MTAPRTPLKAQSVEGCLATGLTGEGRRLAYEPVFAFAWIAFFAETFVGKVT
jgi:hypothetical protein